MKLSIITTVYQAEKDLPRLLDSMMEQKSPELEFFLIDNGCTDGSAKICAEYASRDPRFKIHTLEKNIGYIAARNLGIDVVDADYIGFCDSDDYLEPGGYDTIIEKIKETECDLLIGGWNTVKDDCVTTYIPPFTPGIYTKNQNLESIIPQFFGHYDGAADLKGFMWKQVFRQSLFKDSGIRFREDLKPYEDMMLNAQFIKICNRVVVTDTIIYNYVQHSDSITIQLVDRFNPREEIFRISGLISGLKAEAEDGLSQLACANLGLAKVMTVLSISSRQKRTSEEITREILGTLPEQVRIFISKTSQSKLWAYKMLRWCLQIGTIVPVYFALKLRNS